VPFAGHRPIGADFPLALGALFIFQTAIHHLSSRRVNRLEDEGELLSKKLLPLFRSFRPF